MQAIGKFLDAWMEPVRRLVNMAVVAIFTVIVLVVFSQVIWRFIFNAPFSWSEELARHLQVWLILLTSSVCIRKGRHLSVDYATHALPFGLSRMLKLIIMVVVMFFLWTVIIFSIQMLAITIHQITPAIRIPVLFVYLSLPVTGLLMFLETFILFCKTVNAKDKSEMDAIFTKAD